AVAQALALYDAERAGIQQELPIASQSVAAAAAAPAPQLEMHAYGSGDAFIGTCPECSSDLQFAEGCVKCYAAGTASAGEVTTSPRPWPPCSSRPP
ncbi:MAG: hypothetical protein GWO02_00205, partial [Gammaproteobacteria bacterium]|nr:hypothetical protein [Gammaproteobacteria bacterium]